MNNKLILGLLMVVVCSQANAGWLHSPSDLGKQSIEIAYQLNQFAEMNKTDLCAGDVNIAAAYIESAGRELQRDQRTKALTSLSYGQNELKEISNVRSYCANLAVSVKPYLAKVILIKSEVENEPLPAPDQTSDWVARARIF